MLSLLRLLLAFPGYIAIAALAFAGWLSGTELLRTMSAVQTRGEIVGIVANCEMKATVSRSVGYKTVLRGTVPCDEVEAEQRAHPGVTFSVLRQAKVTVAFATTGGERLEATAREVDLRLTPSAKVGDTVAMTYDPQNPRKIQAVGGDYQTALVSTIFGLIAAAFWLLRRLIFGSGTAAEPKPTETAVTVQRAVAASAAEPRAARSTAPSAPNRPARPAVTASQPAGFGRRG